MKGGMLKSNTSTMVFYYPWQLHPVLYRQKWNTVINSYIFPIFFYPSSPFFHDPTSPSSPSHVTIIRSAFVNSAFLLEFLETLILLRIIKAAGLRANLTENSGVSSWPLFIMTSFCMIFFFYPPYTLHIFTHFTGAFVPLREREHAQASRGSVSC